MGSNVFEAAWSGGATVWDVAYVNTWEGIGDTVELPCYVGGSGSPVGGYLGGDQAYMMVAWGNAEDPKGQCWSCFNAWVWCAVAWRLVAG